MSWFYQSHKVFNFSLVNQFLFCSQAKSNQRICSILSTSTKPTLTIYSTWTSCIFCQMLDVSYETKSGRFVTIARNLLIQHVRWNLSWRGAGGFYVVADSPRLHFIVILSLLCRKFENIFLVTINHSNYTILYVYW